MTNVFRSLLAVAVCFLALTPRNGCAADAPLDIGDKSQLVADKTWVQSAERASFTLHPARKHPANPLVKANRPWEGWRVSIYGSVLFDEDEKLFITSSAQ